MKKGIVRCRCGHRVLAKEVLRTDLYEKGRGKEYVYVRFRCRHCKRIGEVFVPEPHWDWSSLEESRDEMTETERNHFELREPISEDEVMDFHHHLENLGEGADLKTLWGGAVPGEPGLGSTGETSGPNETLRGTGTLPNKHGATAGEDSGPELKKGGTGKGNGSRRDGPKGNGSMPPPEDLPSNAH